MLICVEIFIVFLKLDLIRSLVQGLTRSTFQGVFPKVREHNIICKSVTKICVDLSNKLESSNLNSSTITKLHRSLNQSISEMSGFHLSLLYVYPIDLKIQTKIMKNR